MDWLKSVPRRATKFARLGWAEKRLFIRIVALLVRVRLALWFRPFQRVRETAERLGERRVGENVKRLSAHDITSLVTVGASYIPEATCLTQALVAQIILKQFGYAPELKIGVGRGESRRFQAHAWIELDGKVIIGQVQMLAQYTPLPQLAPAQLENSRPPVAINHVKAHQ